MNASVKAQLTKAVCVVTGAAALCGGWELCKLML